MKLEQIGKKSVWVTDAPDWIDSGQESVLVGMMPLSLNRRYQRGLRYSLGQLYGIVCPGIILGEHVFRGFKRDMLTDDSEDADVEKLAITWNAKQDAFLGGLREDPRVEYSAVPEKRVFAVYMSPNKMLTEFPQIKAWIEHWAWIAVDPALDGAPVDWQIRYDERVWSRK